MPPKRACCVGGSQLSQVARTRRRRYRAKRKTGGRTTLITRPPYASRPSEPPREGAPNAAHLHCYFVERCPVPQQSPNRLAGPSLGGGTARLQRPAKVVD